MATPATATAPDASLDATLVASYLDSPDADLELECASEQAGPSDNGTPLAPGNVYKVHRHRLAAVSTVFRDMLETCGPQTENPLPRIKLQETGPTILALLLYVYNAPQLSDMLKVGKPFTSILAVYEAASKYEMHPLRMLCASIFW